MYTLVIWTVIAVHGFGGSGNFETKVFKDWRPIAQMQSLEACSKAARDLGYNDNKNYRCISSN